MEKTTTVEKVGVYISVSKLPTTVGQTVQLIKYIRNDGDSSKKNRNNRRVNKERIKLHK